MSKRRKPYERGSRPEVAITRSPQVVFHTVKGKLHAANQKLVRQALAKNKQPFKWIWHKDHFEPLVELPNNSSRKFHGDIVDATQFRCIVNALDQHDITMKEVCVILTKSIDYFCERYDFKDRCKRYKHEVHELRSRVTDLQEKLIQCKEQNEKLIASNKWHEDQYNLVCDKLRQKEYCQRMFEIKENSFASSTHCGGQGSIRYEGGVLQVSKRSSESQSGPTTRTGDHYKADSRVSLLSSQSGGSPLKNRVTNCSSHFVPKVPATFIDLTRKMESIHEHQVSRNDNTMDESRERGVSYYSNLSTRIVPFQFEDDEEEDSNTNVVGEMGGSNGRCRKDEDAENAIFDCARQRIVEHGGSCSKDDMLEIEDSVETSCQHRFSVTKPMMMMNSHEEPLLINGIACSLDNMEEDSSVMQYDQYNDAESLSLKSKQRRVITRCPWTFDE